MSETRTERPVVNACTQGPSPRLNGSSSMRSAPGPVAHTDSWPWAPSITVIEAPVIGSHVTQARHTARAASAESADSASLSARLRPTWSTTPRARRAGPGRRAPHGLDPHRPDLPVLLSRSAIHDESCAAPDEVRVESPCPRDHVRPPEGDDDATPPVTRPVAPGPGVDD